MSQEDEQEQKYKRVVVWEGEWSVYRHFARSLLGIRNWFVQSTKNTINVTCSTTQKATNLVEQSFESMIFISTFIYIVFFLNAYHSLTMQRTHIYIFIHSSLLSLPTI